MIEIHGHLLPGVDDGPENIEMALALVEKCIESGVDRVITTPHYMPGKYDNSHVAEGYQRLVQGIEAKGISLKVYIGNEIKLEENTLADLKCGKIYTMANSDYILIELPSFKLYPSHFDLLHKIALEGYRLILAHVDRYDYLIENPKLIEELHRLGYFMQINISGLLKWQKRGIILKWIKNGYIQFASSDFHDLNRRKPILDKGYQIIRKAINKDVADLLCSLNGENVIQNKIISLASIKNKTQRRST